MDSNVDAMLMLANFRNRELQAEAARFRLAREAYGDGPTLRATIAAACPQLGVTLVRAREELEFIDKWTLTLPRRGALPR